MPGYSLCCHKICAGVSLLSAGLQSLKKVILETPGETYFS